METPKTAEETLYTYHPIKHDLKLRTDLWPTSTVVDSMEEYASIKAEQARREERGKHDALVGEAIKALQYYRDRGFKCAADNVQDALAAAGYNEEKEGK